MIAPFFTIKPEIPGRLRWSGTNTLIFTPSDPAKLPYATRYDVTVGEGATSVASRRLARPYTFSFTTPTVRLLRVGWYRRGRRYDAPVVIALHFSQPVTREGVAPHLRLELAPHDFVVPVLPPEGLERLKPLDPKAREDFEAKVARARQVAASRDPPRGFGAGRARPARRGGDRGEIAPWRASGKPFATRSGASSADPA